MPLSSQPHNLPMRNKFRIVFPSSRTLKRSDSRALLETVANAFVLLSYEYKDQLRRLQRFSLRVS
jgi:hypothetical protein